MRTGRRCRRTVWIARRDGSGTRQLTFPSAAAKRLGRISDYTPAWAPDSRTVYFARATPATYTASIFAIRADRWALRQVTRAKLSYGDGDCHSTPEPSPHGDVVAYIDAGCRPRWAYVAAVTTAGRPARLSFRFKDFPNGERHLERRVVTRWSHTRFTA